MAALDLLLTARDAGGAEILALLIAQQWQADGIDLRVIAPEGLRRAEAIAAVRWVAATGRPARQLRWDELPIAWDVERDAASNHARHAEVLGPVLERRRHALAVLNLGWPRHGLGLMRALQQQRRNILTIHHLAPAKGSLAATERAGLELSAMRHVAVSDYVASRVAALFQVAPAMIGVVPNGILIAAGQAPPTAVDRRVAKRGLAAGLGMEPDRLWATCVARFGPHKGHADLVEVATRLPSDSGWQVLCLGEGPAREEVRTVLRRRGLLNRIVFCPGAVLDVASHLAATDLFYLPTYLEGQSLALLEAAARGCPILTTTASGQDVWLRHDVDAVLTAPGDVDDQLCWFSRLAADPSRRVRLGIGARRMADAYPLARTLSAYSLIARGMLSANAHESIHG